MRPKFSAGPHAAHLSLPCSAQGHLGHHVINLLLGTLAQATLTLATDQEGSHQGTQGFLCVHSEPAGLSKRGEQPGTCSAHDAMEVGRRQERRLMGWNEGGGYHTDAHKLLELTNIPITARTHTQATNTSTQDLQ